MMGDGNVDFNGAPPSAALDRWAEKMDAPRFKWKWTVASFESPGGRRGSDLSPHENVLYFVSRTRLYPPEAGKNPLLKPHKYGAFGCQFTSDHSILVDRFLASRAVQIMAPLADDRPRPHVVHAVPPLETAAGLYPFDFHMSDETKLAVANAQIRSGNAIRVGARHLYSMQSLSFGDKEALALIEKSRQRTHDKFRAEFGVPGSSPARQRWTKALLRSQAQGELNGATYGTRVFGDIVTYSHLKRVMGPDVDEFALRRDLHDLAREGKIFTADFGNTILPTNWTVPLELSQALAGDKQSPTADEYFTLYESFDPVSRPHITKAIPQLRRFSDLAAALVDGNAEPVRPPLMIPRFQPDDGIDLSLGL